ncbi:ubiquitin-conjugating enzyme E2 E2 [Aphelenchoides avenae]|nr:ubiquitin-conjugating enzyme E2 E2 [Aphelenchus avenae]
MSGRRGVVSVRMHPYSDVATSSTVHRRPRMHTTSVSSAGEGPSTSPAHATGATNSYATATSSIAARRLLKEIEHLKKHPLTGCSAAPREENILQWTAVIEGPPNTVYEGGTFFVELIFSEEYPFIAPKVSFLTRIYHCNINSQGKVCVDRISSGWNSAMTISTVLQSIVSLLYSCNPRDALVSSIAEQYVKEPEEYEKMARIWTQRYAR